MRRDHDEYDEIYRLDMKREWTESAYDETGDSVFCDICGGEMKWQPNENLWRCADCVQEMRRAVYFDYIGAEPPGSECLTHCRENYPFCKKYCDRYLIDPRDPMLT
jgi:ribosomal protein L37AE/L43A